MKNLNILQLLQPKGTIAYLKEDITLRQAAEKMRHHGYTAVPVISADGKYAGTLAEGDFLWFMLKNGIGELTGLEKYLLKEMPRRVKCESVSVNSTIEDLFMLSMNQNFVPIVDDRGVFIGIVTRRDILQACYAGLKDSGIFSAQPEYELEEDA